MGHIGGCSVIGEQFNIQQTTFNKQHSTFSIQHPTTKIQLARILILRFTIAMRQSIC